MKKIGILFLGCLFFQSLYAQQADSSFHNYWYDSRLQYFKQLPAKKGPVLFWGDSITEWADWNELTGLGNVLNRGIAGDITYGLQHRVDEVVRHKPRKVFILIGTNDINKGIAVPAIVRTYTALLEQLKIDLPKTKLYVQSVFPINDSLINRQYYKGTNAQIFQLNAALKAMSNEVGATYVDVYPAMLDTKEQMNQEYTYDGLHLSGKGYLQWVAFLRKQKLL